MRGNSLAHGSGFKACFLCGVKYYALSKKCLYCQDCSVDRTEYMKNYYNKVTKVKNMDKKIKSAQKKIDDKLKDAQKVEKVEFKGLLKEDKKLDAKRDRLETALHKQKKK